MSECSICGEYSDCLHPVSFRRDSKLKTPKKIEEFMDIGNGCVDDLDMGEADEEFWESCARICHDCFKKYAKWIAWWG